MTKTPPPTHHLPVLEKPAVQLGFSLRNKPRPHWVVQHGGVTKILWIPKDKQRTSPPRQIIRASGSWFIHSLVNHASLSGLFQGHALSAGSASLASQLTLSLDNCFTGM